jgi:hypothetical protein
MNNSPNQNHLNCHNECIHHIDIIACGFSIQPYHSEFILPNLHVFTLIAFLQLFCGGFFWRQLRFGRNWLCIIFWWIILEAAQIWRELAPHYFLVDCFGGTQLYCTLSMYVTSKTISRRNQKTNTTAQLYCTLST